MFKYFCFVLVFCALVNVSLAGSTTLAYYEAADGSHNANYSAAYTVTVQPSTGIADDTYTIWGHWSWSGQGPVGSGTATSDVVMGSVKIVGGVVASYPATPNFTMSVNAMNANVPSGHGPTSQDSPSTGVWNGTLVMTYTLVKNSSGVSVPFQALATSDPYSVQFWSTDSLPTVTSFGEAITLVIGNGGSSVQFPAKLSANDGKAHEVEITVNGTATQGWTVPAGVAGGAAVTNTLTLTQTCRNGDAIAFTVDGALTGKDSGIVNLAGGATGYWTPFVWSWNLTTPPPQGTPTGTASNSGNTTTTNDSDNSPGSSTSGPQNTPPSTGQTTVVNNPNTTISGTGAGATNQDIYNDVLQALQDAGNNSTAATVASFTPGLDVGTQPTGVGGNQGTQLQTDATQAINEWQTASTSGKSLISSLGPGGSNTLQLPSPGSLGTAYTFQLSTMHIGTAALSLTLDLTPYQNIISGFRLCGAFFLGVSGFFAAIKIIRSGVA
ncbi:MAG TPA: hypothetical protein VGM54_13440 [Chthoniobacter sp.]|jgi:hypothetical protein